ncbi:MAG: trypsin-like peptidase domain-containing protein [Anaerolineaceae bacterium]|nr:trypsin-like peptidase domain-containing protein [Anaerolineaceae bacterium]
MSDILQQLSDQMAATAETAGASIVRVEARRRLPASGIVWAADGVIVTANHVVQDDEEIQIGLPNGETVPATLVGRDPNTDIAILRAQAELTVPNWVEADDLKVGHLILALGRPGENIQATLGVVSARGEMMAEGLPFPPGFPFGRMPHQFHEHHEHEHHGPGGRRGEHRGPEGRRSERKEKRDEFMEKRAFRKMKRRGMGMEAWWGMRAVGSATEGFIQTDVVMYPGFSGGPLVDASGRVYGMNTSGFMRGQSLAVPTKTIQGVAETLLQHGRIRRGFLGISAQPVRLPEKLAEELDQDTGLLLVSVEPGSPAEHGGLLLGDVVVSLDGIQIERLEELLALLSGERVGREVPVSFIRGGELRELGVTIGERM